MKKKKILAVDDDPTAVNALRQILTQKGYDVTTAADGEAARDALESRAEPVPLWIRNAPTGLMKDLGYGRDYQYAHDTAEGVAAMDCLPEALAGRRYYEPTTRGAEVAISERLDAARRLRKPSPESD